jgi:ribosomal protein S12 methylthiotransferase
MKENTFHLISLGCAKNTVDSDSMAQLLLADGYSASEDPALADILIVNTCGFIDSARAESIQVLQELAAEKEEGQLLIAAGCLSQRFSEMVAEQVPAVDGILGTRRWMDIVSVVKKLRKMRNNYHPEVLYHLPENATTVGADPAETLRANVFGSSAYLKIADGCRRPCAFCSIPLIKGTLVSRPLDAILEEAQILAANGVRELILIAQDTTDYGHDLGMKDGLAILLEKLTETAPDLDWIRVMYAYPGYVTDRLIDVMAEKPQILPYLDIPLQHASPATLKRMKRPANMDWVRETLAKMRARIPNLTIRTTFIVGYPGESEEEFQALLDFIEEMRFDRVGAFTFSFEPGTASEPLGDSVPEAVKNERWEKLMERQQNISLQINQAYVGKTLDILIEGYDEEQNIAIGRSYRDAPEIDGLVFIEGNAQVGEILPVRITGAMAYDLTGVLI